MKLWQLNKHRKVDIYELYRTIGIINDYEAKENQNDRTSKRIKLLCQLVFTVFQQQSRLESRNSSKSKTVYYEQIGDRTMEFNGTVDIKKILETWIATQDDNLMIQEVQELLIDVCDKLVYIHNTAYANDYADISIDTLYEIQHFFYEDRVVGLNGVQSFIDAVDYIYQVAVDYMVIDEPLTDMIGVIFGSRFEYLVNEGDY